MKEIDFRHTIVGQGLLWFGAAISIAEIVTGMLIGSLGIIKGIAAIILGHSIGAAILFLAGYIGAERTRNYSRNSKNIFRTKRNYYIFHI